ncbi:DUF2490 domain-containing protein [Dyadobacter tibetensis]|uniref:DUF2490 domain-containing protein n=1 Tax=Dyadobacter tibetensis TaxID=1211851 RepID=UPI00047131D1|nr:DUF2490 domain-containing protein [Dyadobacter tibetensis]
MNTIRLYTLLLIVLHQGLAYGQDNTRYNAWTRLTVQTTLNPRFILDNEIQHRRQNDFDNRNFFSKNLLTSYRSWIHYRPSRKVQLSLSPFAFFNQYPSYRQPADGNKSNLHELRFAGAFTLHQPLFSSLYLFSKTGLEYRSFIDQTDKLRARERIGLSYSYNNWQVSIYEELLLHVAGVPISNFFDQNRLSASISLSPTDRLGLEFGYIHTDKLPGKSSSLTQEENLFLNLSYKIGKL